MQRLRLQTIREPGLRRAYILPMQRGQTETAAEEAAGAEL